MPRKFARARRRYARVERELADFRRREAAAVVRNDMQEVAAIREQWAAYVRRLAAGPERLWAFESHLIDPTAEPEDVDATRAFIGRLAAPKVAVRTSGHVHRRHALGDQAGTPRE